MAILLGDGSIIVITYFFVAGYLGAARVFREWDIELLIVVIIVSLVGLILIAGAVSGIIKCNC